MYNQNNNQPRPAQSLGAAQESFKYNFAKGFNPGDQFTIIEDTPRNKPLRFEIGEGKSKDGRTFESKTYVIKVISRGIEADMRVYPKLLPGLASLCPKGIENFKGTTFVFDGLNWSYMGIETNINTQPQVVTPPRDPRQPNLYPAPQQTTPITQPEQSTQHPNQVDIYTNQLISGIRALDALGTKVYASDAMKIADKISPGNAVNLIGQAKTRGLIYEQDNVYKVS